MSSTQINYENEKLIKQFGDACGKGYLDEISQIIKENKSFLKANNCLELNKGLLIACECHQLKVVKYLLGSNEFDMYADANFQEGSPLYWSSGYGYLDIVKYLLESPDLLEKANVHANNDHVFKIACLNGVDKVIHYLIFEYNIEKTENIKAHLGVGTTEITKQAIKWFDMRNTYNKLHEELPKKNHGVNKLKL